MAIFQPSAPHCTPRSRRAVLGGGVASGVAILAPGLAPRAQAAAMADAAKAASWPERPVRIVVPAPPGSTPDITARLLADYCTQALGQPFVADSRAGAGGMLGAEAVARANDGHTIGLCFNGATTTAPFLYPHLPYDPAKDLQPVSLLVRAPQLLVVRPDLPAQDLPGLIAYAKAHPDRLSYGSVGAGSAGHLAMEELKARAGIQLEHVPYRGFPPAVLDLLAGRIDAIFMTTAGILPQLQAGKVRALAVTAERRLPQAPAIPTMAEAGQPDAASYAWNGVIAPTGMPPARIELLAQACHAAMVTPAATSALEALGCEVIGSTPAAFGRFEADEAQRWGGLIKRLGIQAE